jgi:hypothetical protein
MDFALDPDIEAYRQGLRRFATKNLGLPDDAEHGRPRTAAGSRDHVRRGRTGRRHAPRSPVTGRDLLGGTNAFLEKRPAQFRGR